MFADSSAISNYNENRNGRFNSDSVTIESANLLVPDKTADHSEAHTQSVSFAVDAVKGAVLSRCPQGVDHNLTENPGTQAVSFAVSNPCSTFASGIGMTPFPG